MFSKYVWVIPLKYNKGTSIVNAFQKIISKERKPNKIWVDQGSEFYNKVFKDFLKINNIEMYSTFNDGKSVVAEKFLSTNISLLKDILLIVQKKFLLLIKLIIQFLGLMLLMI